MKHLLVAFLFATFAFTDAGADDASDRAAIRQAALEYIESQHEPDPSRMDRALHGEMKKRTDHSASQARASARLEKTL